VSFFSLLCIALSTFHSSFASPSTLNKEEIKDIHDVLEIKVFEIAEQRAIIMLNLFFYCYEISIVLLLVIIWKLMSYLSIPTSLICTNPNDETFKILGLFALCCLLICVVVPIANCPDVKKSRRTIANRVQQLDTAADADADQSVINEKGWAQEECEKISALPSLDDLKRKILHSLQEMNWFTKMIIIAGLVTAYYYSIAAIIKAAH
jgi:hypothetical protein